MKKELSSIEIRFLVKELQYLSCTKVDQIYQPGAKEILIQIHITNKGRALLRILLPNFMWISAMKQEMPDKMSNFCSFLRKHLENSRIMKIEQYESERIVKIEFEKQEKYELYIELFSKGNIILCKNNIILMPLETQTWKDRAVKRDEKYVFSSRANVFKMNLREFEAKILESKENISRTLATGLGLGGIYSEEACSRAGINKLEKMKNKENIRKVYTALIGLIEEKANPQVVYENNTVKDITPFALQIYGHLNKKSFESYSQALDSVLSDLTAIERKEKANKSYDDKLKQINKKIEMQAKNLNILEQESEENRRKGESIYENYQDIKQLLDSVKKSIKDTGLKELQEKHKRIKKINEKTKEIYIEL